MENNPSNSTVSTSAKDFFLHLGAMVTLYAVAIALVNLLFTVINNAYPAVNEFSYYYSPSISFPVATLIVIFPIFILLSWLVYKSYEAEPEKKQLGIRRWLTYITLFIAGAILAGDLVAVLYKFLDGQDLTTAFILKALVVLVLTGALFKFYLDEIRDRASSQRRKMWAIASAIVILASIILGFSVIGSPATQRLLRYDDRKISDLHSIQWQIVNHFQRSGTLPQSLVQLSDPISSFMVPNDPQTDLPYEYNVTGPMSFELCAVFNKDAAAKTLGMSRAAMPRAPFGQGFEYWDYSAGRHCFDRTIDPNLYPVNKPVPPVDKSGR